MQRLIRTSVATAASAAFAFALLWTGLPAAWAAAIGGPFELDRSHRADGDRGKLRRPLPAGLLRLRLLPGHLPDGTAHHGPGRGRARRSRRRGAAALRHGRPRARHGRVPCRIRAHVPPAPGRPHRQRRADSTPLVKAYRVYYRLNEPDEDGAYLVDHTSYIYFMDPDGDYLTHFVFGQGPEKMAEVMRKHLD